LEGAERKILGYLNSTRIMDAGEDLDDLKENLRDLYEMFRGRGLPGIKRVAELELT